jgi:hypothetical protein
MPDSWPPVPDPFGSLEPPRRNPPTAVGVATPPPPGGGGRPTYVDRRAWRRRRLARAFVGTVLTASATALATTGTIWSTIASAGLGGMGGFLLYLSIKPMGLWRQAKGFTLAALGRHGSRSRRRAA